MTLPKTSKSEIVICATILLLLFLLGSYQKKTEVRTAIRSSESLNYLPSGIFLKGMALSYDEALADFLWVRTVGYFGAHAKTDQDYTWLTHMLTLIAELDPLYESPYEFAGVILPSELGKVDEAIAFLEKGIKQIPKHNPRYWLQPFYLGFIFMIYKNEPITAARYFEMAATFPQRPDFLPLLVTRLYAVGNRPEDGISIIRNMLNEPDSTIAGNEHMRHALEKRLKELIVVAHIRMLEKAVGEYIRLNNKKPSRLNDLVDAAIIPAIPAEPHGGQYFLSDSGDQVFSSMADKNLELHTDKLNIKNKNPLSGVEIKAQER